MPRKTRTLSQVLVITKDKDFYRLVAREVRQVQDGSRPIRRVEGAGALPPLVGLEDVILVDAREGPQNIPLLSALPCGKIYVRGPSASALQDLRRTFSILTQQSLEPARQNSRDGTQAAKKKLEGAVAAGASEPLLTLACRLATLKPETIHEACRELLPRILGAGKASGYMYHPQFNQLELAWRVPDDPITEMLAISPFKTDSPIALVANRRQVWFAENVDDELTAMGLAMLRPHAGRYETGSCIVAPVIAGAELLGVLNFADPVDGGCFDRARLEHVVEGITNLLAATWQNISIMHSLETAARTDALTGLGNYRTFEDNVSREVTRAHRYGSPLSIIMMDVDNLKLVNDHFGHQAGDILLREVGRRIAGAIRETDIAARHGGDEFSVILPSTSLEAAKPVFARINRAVNGASIQWLKHVFATSVSVALGEYDGDSSASEFLSRVDRTLYARKLSEHATLPDWDDDSETSPV